MSIEQEFTKILGRAPSVDEAAALQRIREALRIDDNDALWQILLAFQYHKVLYDEMPGKIAATVQNIKEELEVVAKAEASKAQASLTEAVVAEARKMSTKMDFAKLFASSALALVFLILFGSFCFMAGLGAAYGDLKVSDALKIPSGFIICGLFLTIGILCIIQGAKALSGGHKGSGKFLLAGLAQIFFGALLLALSF